MNLARALLIFFISFRVMGQTIDSPETVQQIQEQLKVYQEKEKEQKAVSSAQLQAGSINSKVLEQNVANRVKDPFMLPNNLYIKIRKKLSEVSGEGIVDESIEPQKRWALKHYKLIAIIWNVKNPKAMITDKVNVLHMFQVGNHIGNNDGVITSINNGQVVVDENGAKTILRMSK